jgi:hypothetical protein
VGVCTNHDLVPLPSPLSYISGIKRALKAKTVLASITKNSVFIRVDGMLIES